MKGLLIVMTVAAVFACALCQRPDKDKCGERPHYRNSDLPDDVLGKVVGGNASRTEDHKWQVAMLRSGSFICGGSIIEDNVILTAAHCTTNTNAALYSIVRTSKRNPLDSWAQTRSVKQVINHPSYSGSTYNNDISLLILNTRFDFSGPNENRVGEVCYQANVPKDDERAISTGWGSTFSGGSVVNDLREAYMPITKEADIRAIYGNSYNPVTMIGAAYRGDGLDTCQGDSGGPLSVARSNNDMGRLTVVGIVSWGYGCGNVGIYTRVSNYKQWIDQHVNNNP